MKKDPVLIKESMAGGPITCLSLPSREFCLWNQGPFLLRHRTTWHIASEEEPEEHDNDDDSWRDRILVFTKQSATIHGLRYLAHLKLDESDVALVFGGRLMAFVGNALQLKKPLKVLSLREVEGEKEENEASNNCLLLSDWIWDCQFMENQLVVGLAHNTIQLFDVHYHHSRSSVRVRPLRSIPGANTSITYALNISPSSGRIAVGSVVQDIFVWSLSTSRFRTATSRQDDQEDKNQHYHSLKGHRGVIHAVQFDEMGNRIASASDDRTVRMFTFDRDLDQWTATWTGWGHSARCWCVQFCSSSSGVVESSLPASLVISTGEDGTARLWAADNGASLAVLRGHACQSIWRVDTFGLLAVTGANNGTLALYDLTLCLDDAVASKRLHLPGCSEKHPESSGREVITGMQFYVEPGSLISFDTVTGRSVELTPWYRDSMKVERDVIPSIESISIHPSSTFVAIGTTKGDVILVPMQVKEVSDDNDEELVVLPSRHGGCVKRLVWFEDILLSFHVQTILWWELHTRKGYGMLDNFDYQQLKPGTHGMPNCAAWNVFTRQLVVGDTRGCLSLFALRQQQTKGSVVGPISTINCAHGREHVKDVLWTTGHRVLSVGNNGCICECSVIAGQLRPLLSISISPLTGVERLWISRKSQSTIVGGYYGNVFALKHFETGYEFLRIDTGGRQRDICLSIEELHSSSDRNAFVCFAVAVNRRGGGHDIQLTRRKAFGLQIRPGLSAGANKLGRGAFWSLGVGLHGETTFDACIGVDHMPDSILIVTGSEDCSSRVSILRDGSFISSKQLPLQVSSVRTVCFSHRVSFGKSLIAVGGSRLTLQFFSIGNCDVDIVVEFLGQGKHPEKATIDHRINALAAVPTEQAGGGFHLVVSGDSNGGCYLYRVSESHNGPSFGRLLFRSERPILSLSLTRLARMLILLVGTSGGELTMLDVTGAEADLNCQLCPRILRCKPHAIGTNSISARSLQDDEGVIRICTGGDDQAIYCCDVKVSAPSPGQATSATILRSVSVPGACDSAIRGISWIDDVHMCVTSYDQQLLLLKVSYPCLRFLTKAPVDVGDVNAIACGCAPCRGHYLAVAGAGVEIFFLEF